MVDLLFHQGLTWWARYSWENKVGLRLLKTVPDPGSLGLAVLWRSFIEIDHVNILLSIMMTFLNLKLAVIAWLFILWDLTGFRTHVVGPLAKAFGRFPSDLISYRWSHNPRFPLQDSTSIDLLIDSLRLFDISQENILVVGETSEQGIRLISLNEQPLSIMKFEKWFALVNCPHILQL